MTARNPKAVYACINDGETVCPKEITAQSICINSDIYREEVLTAEKNVYIYWHSKGARSYGNQLVEGILNVMKEM